MKLAPPPRWVLWAILLAALAVRIAWGIVVQQRAGANFEFDDEHLHWSIAANLVERGAFVTDDGRHAARMPVYPLFLACFAWMGTAGVLAARMAQALIGAATAWVVHATLRRRAGPWPALLATAAVALDPYLVMFSGLLLTEVLFTFFAVLLLRVSMELWQAPAGTGGRHAFLVGLWGAAAVMTRPSSLGWIVVVWVILVFASRGAGIGVRRTAIFAVIFAAAMVPWGMRNRAVIGDAAWLSANGGVTLYDAQGPQARGDSNQSFLAEMPELDKLGEVERDGELRRLAIEQMRRDPARVLRLAAVKLGRTWNVVPNYGGYRNWVLMAVSGAWSVSVYGLAIVGLFRWRDRRTLLLLWLPIVYFSIVHAVFVGSLRYRVPLMPFLEMSAAGAFMGWIRDDAPPEMPEG
jgi:hypothetical protein